MNLFEIAGLLNPEMAETIPEHISELTASPSRDLAQDVSQDFGDAQYDDNEYPFAQGVMNGAKCCSKCGATKTPQWREGPFGPKTLCNACGVKRTRKLRAEQEGAKRRKTGSQSPAPAKVSYQKATAKAVPAFSPEPINSYGSLELDQFESFAPAAVLPAAMAAARRPTRRAAEEAAAKTRCWAGVVDHHQEEAHIYRAASPAQAATPTSSSDFSHPSSECPEEVAWTPMAADGAKHGMDLDACAAVNLMTMSVRQAGEPLQQPPQQSSPSVSIGQTKDLEQVNHDTLLGLMAKYEGGEAAHHKAVAMDIADLYKCLPPNKVMELVRLNQELDTSVHEAHAANAAVAAVAKVLAAKQAAALRARETAGNATKRLRRFMAELDTQFGIQTKLVHSRSRASPKRGPHLMH